MKGLIKRLHWARLTILLLSNWPEVYWHKYVTRWNGHETFKLRNGLTFEVANKDSTFPIVVEVLHDKTYGDLSQVKKDAKVVIDIGGNIGTFSILALQSLLETKIYSFEPEPLNFGLLTKNIAQNGYADRAVLINKAVTGKEEKRTLYFQENSGTNSMFEKKGKAVEVECISLAKIFSEYAIDHCDLLKVDCEGAEYEIFLNAPKEVFSKIDHLILEWHDVEGHNADELESLLISAGFTVHKDRLLPLLIAKR